MDDLTQELQGAAEELTPHWDVERSARLYASTQQLGRRRSVQRAAAGSLIAVAAGVGLVLGVGRGNETAQVPTAERAPSAEASNVHTLRLADGSRADFAGAHSDLEVLENNDSRISVRLAAGRAHFDVVHKTARSFVVEAEPYRVEVIGTVFDVERGSDSVSVSVSRGKVRVYGPLGAEDLVAGQIKHFSRAVEPVAGTALKTLPPLVEADPGQSEPQRPQPHAAKAHRSADAWRSLSQSGQYDAAFESLRTGSVVDDEPAALMDAADAARLSGHPQNAVRYLQGVVERHQGSPVAPLAAFTLGRVYLDQLGQPDQAAESFERARKLAPNGSLAQDALAREVEALSKGGYAQRAYQRAQEYLRSYPNGRRVRAVQLYGGLE
jgi:transmembrane sensor